ncbi:sugar phosphate nucleotidyltransferase [Tractidigestivibacter sp.]|uniref:sugar phosphate nucleotidyltransferase n=1 Tax=Tractidigestivibacter sp. TaxID=2847320 RepID=UPI003D929444
MNHKEFLVLSTLATSNGPLTQRAIAAKTGMSVGSVNDFISRLTDAGYVANRCVTDDGLEALEPYRVKRAILIAAGFGSRMAPITLNTPKPLVRVGGTRIIDTILDAVFAAGITEVYIVRGYLGEQFDQLLYKYPTIKFIENPLYNDSNNISSMLAAKDLLQSAYVFESDLLLRNGELITKYQDRSNYLAVPMERSDDWCFTVEKSGVIKNFALGGEGGVEQMVGISYWTDEDGARLAKDIPATFEMPGGKERFWDEVALSYCRENYKVYTRPCTLEDVTEIDSFRELQALDPAYAC